MPSLATRFFLSLALVTGCYSVSPATAQTIVGFSRTQDTGYGTSIFVVGSADVLGNWAPTGSVKLRWTSGNVWTGQVALPAGANVEYKYIWRSTATGQICNGANVTWMPDPNLATNLPAGAAAPYPGKTIFYHSSWTNADVVYRIGTNWYGAAMERIGPGRTTNEFRYRVTGIGAPGQGLELLFNGYLNGVQSWDNAPIPNPVSGANNYFTALDAFFVQGGNVFDYEPPAALDNPYTFVTNVNSTVADIQARTIRIRLPRGYAQNTWKRYPVLYMHDGQNVFDPGGGNGSWSADQTSANEIGQGRMRELIIVGMDNTSDRRAEYMPNGDSYGPVPPESPGKGWDYLRFVLDNVKPTLDYNFRTQTGARNTGIMGSSLGGIISVYFGCETNVFGIVGAMSPSFGRATNYANAFPNKAKIPLRVYIDTGTGEGLVGDYGGASYWEPVLAGYDAFLKQGYAPGLDLMWAQGCGQVHNEAAWASRLPAAFRFLFPPGDEPNRLEHIVYPPALHSLQRNGEQLVMSHDALAHQRYELDTATNIAGPWTAIATTAPASAAWSYPAITGQVMNETGLFRLRAAADP